MKGLLAVSLVANAVLVIGLLWKDANVHAEVGGTGGGTPVANGDVNGDGKINVSDAIGLLLWIFKVGSAPEPIECKVGLPATGQKKCYAGGVEIDCADLRFPGQDGLFQAGCPGGGRFVDNEDGTVTDNCTGLMWQKDTADVSGDESIGDEDRLDWVDALKYCMNLDFAGHHDWRLPNVRELHSIVDYGRGNPVIDPVFGAESYWYWSSSSGALYPDFAWFVYFLRGDVSGSGQSSLFFVRAVRGGFD